MKKDIPKHKVEDLAIAIVPRKEVIINPEEDLWDTYIINLKDGWRSNESKHTFITSRRPV